ncbi:hypothetical protein GCM10010495_09890 [Kitasatospora herbaricolor]|uniref:hypothetical protein n=1 Tax=Kitasatospora herbaricolor TaxID=68217 RepID=UPI00174B7B1D|nr:hypothetical protein [Kitasatospora herbaricolor]MDQ0309576.1 hypothetical protein [Kitasatospora herbaricolor]GGV00922.1 hypothetical protein GCM10010495_09890 [Kitasatospora herbaricolor]
MAAVETARARAQAVLRVRGRAVAAAVLPAAVAVVLLAGRVTGRLGAPGSPDAAAWDAVRWAVCAVAAATLLVAGLVARARRTAAVPQTPAVPLSRADAPELYRLIGELADRLEVPAPSAIALTPDCDSWLEDVPVPRAGRRAGRGRGDTPPPAPVLVIGSPFLWWMRAGELRALLAPVVAGTAAAADPDIAAARRFVRGLDASLDSGAAPGSAPDPGSDPEPGAGPRGRRGTRLLTDRITRWLLGACREHSAELERAVAGWASEQAKAVDYGLRIAAQEQVGLAYAGWDRMLTRVALPAWKLGRHPCHLNAGVVAALTELSRRDRLAADGYGTRLGDRPACDLLEEPGTVDAAVSLLAAELFFGSPGGPSPAGPAPAPAPLTPGGPGGDCSATAAADGWKELDWADYPTEVVDLGWRTRAAALQAALDRLAPQARPGAPTLTRLLSRLSDGDGEPLAAALASQLARTGRPPSLLEPVRSGRDLLVEHVTAMVCCAAVDTAGGTPGLDWLDGPVLLIGGVRRTDLAEPVAQAVEQGQDGPLRAWLDAAGVRLEKPVRL